VRRIIAGRPAISSSFPEKDRQDAAVLVDKQMK
jgi:hypothetical protein